MTHDIFINSLPAAKLIHFVSPLLAIAISLTAAYALESIALEAADNSEPTSMAAKTSSDESMKREEYRLNLGDKLIIEIYGVERSKRLVIVGGEGTVSYLLVGEIPAVGKTIVELNELLNEKLKPILRHAIINAVPFEFGSRFYTIIGEVKRPGKELIIGQTTLLSAISRAGGFSIGTFRNTTVDLIDFEHSFITRKGEFVPCDFEKLIAGGDISQNIELENEDYIFVASVLKQNLYILGEVKFSRTFTFLKSITLLELLARARGLTSQAGSRILIIRGSLSAPQSIEINIAKILKGVSPDILLKPGDIVYVPPGRFQNLTEILQGGIQTFVSTITSNAGSETFRQIKPDAQATEKTISIP